MRNSSKAGSGDPMPGDYAIYVYEKNEENKTVKTHDNLVSFEVKLSPAASDYVIVPADIKRADIEIRGPIRTGMTAPPSLSPQPWELRVRFKEQRVNLEGVSGFNVEQPIKEVPFEVSVIKEEGTEYAESNNREVGAELKGGGEVKKVIDVSLTGGFKYTTGDTTTKTDGTKVTTTTKYTAVVIDHQKQPKLIPVQ